MFNREYELKLLTLILILILSSCSKSEFDNLLDKNNIPLNFDGDFSLKSISTDPFILIGENLKNKDIIKIHTKDINSLEIAKQEIKKNILLIQSQFEFTLAPYPGQITAASNCGEKFKPQISTFQNLNFLNVFANERLALSICDSDIFYYHVLTSFYLDSSKKKLIIVDYYYRENKDRVLKLFHSKFNKLLNINFAEIDSSLK
jgi:hypothetical protein